MRDCICFCGQSQTVGLKGLCINLEQNRLKRGQAHSSAELILLQQYNRHCMAIINEPGTAVPA